MEENLTVKRLEKRVTPMYWDEIIKINFDVN